MTSLTVDPLVESVPALSDSTAALVVIFQLHRDLVAPSLKASDQI